MAKVRVRALKSGYDGQIRRKPGDEFDFDVKQNGHGTWFEVIEEGPLPIREKTDSKPTSKKKSKKKRKADDLLA